MHRVRRTVLAVKSNVAGGCTDLWDAGSGPDLPNRSCNVLHTGASEEPAAYETSIHNYHTIQRHILEDNGHRHLHENNKSHSYNEMIIFRLYHHILFLLCHPHIHEA